MRNFIADGVTLPFDSAPAGGVTAGEPVFINDLVVVPLDSVGAGYPFTGRRLGMFTVAKVPQTKPKQGQAAYWDESAKKATTSKEDNKFIGYFMKDLGDVAEVVLPGV